MKRGETRIFIADVLSLAEPSQIEIYLNEVSKERREKIKKLKTLTAKALSLGAELVLQKAVRQVYGIEPPLKIRILAEGKPLLHNYPKIHFNLSHSGNYVVCGIGARPLGVDIQKMAEPNLNLAKRFFSETEVTWLFALPPEKQVQGFYDLWAIKEAYMKYTGKGFRLPMNAFTVKSNEQILTENGISIFEAEKKVPVLVKTHRLLEDYVLWGITDSVNFQKTIEWIRL
ncbi:4'-phosphopantetheinyl transferase family protein [Acetobacterium woodii]|uniref:Holo-[acyl-carrier-protein] synthase Sfp n=1 Tax=Acetobacterium woodii (strain ATCC 29683 / DSM 1030 / JCM 2381 / KCTC 1655 / WB1) TaxID=931626 RepID=H6LJ48_ACEWD|nr:4'-phosphopantetheinyl transferase superfamily protein [Acetobacterium woodii]AFA47411.1 holo-[acyl-carrier-protein] synthase Sfp [Acetobacterium woodii DSM 1030]